MKRGGFGIWRSQGGNHGSWNGDYWVKVYRGALGRILCTQDTDSVRFAAEGIPHTGIVVGRPEQHHLGAWVNFLELMDAVLNEAGIRGRIESP